MKYVYIVSGEFTRAFSTARKAAQYVKETYGEYSVYSNDVECTVEDITVPQFIEMINRDASVYVFQYSESLTIRKIAVM